MTLEILTIGLDIDNNPIEKWVVGNVSKHWIGAAWQDEMEIGVVTIVLQGVQLTVKETQELHEVIKEL